MNNIFLKDKDGAAMALRKFVLKNAREINEKLSADSSGTSGIFNDERNASILLSAPLTALGSMGYGAVITVLGNRLHGTTNNYGKADYIEQSVYSSGDSACIINQARYAGINISGESSNVASVASDVTINSGGLNNRVTTNGECSKIYSYADNAVLSVQGESSRVYSYGNNAKIFAGEEKVALLSYGDNAAISSSGNCAQLFLMGQNCTATILGFYSKFSGLNGSNVTMASHTMQKIGDFKSHQIDKLKTCVIGETLAFDGKPIQEKKSYMLIGEEFCNIEMIGNECVLPLEQKDIYGCTVARACHVNDFIRNGRTATIHYMAAKGQFCAYGNSESDSVVKLNLAIEKAAERDMAEKAWQLEQTKFATKKESTEELERE